MCAFGEAGLVKGGELRFRMRALMKFSARVFISSLTLLAAGIAIGYRIGSKEGTLTLQR